MPTIRALGQLDAELLGHRRERRAVGILGPVLNCHKEVEEIAASRATEAIPATALLVDGKARGGVLVVGYRARTDLAHPRLLQLGQGGRVGRQGYDLIQSLEALAEAVRLSASFPLEV